MQTSGLLFNMRYKCVLAIQDGSLNGGFLIGIWSLLLRVVSYLRCCLYHSGWVSNRGCTV